jgi:8-amino-3,8-dideoxy-alpha-D-manno-octulosonate transaminase
LDARSLNRYYGPANQGMVAQFEREATTRLGVRHALAVQSGTSALLVALRALEIGPGDEVLVPASTFIATAMTVLHVGATPVFVEINETGNIDPGDLEHRITPRTKAVIAVPILGVPCEMDAIVAIKKRRKLFLIEDCAQSFGCRYRGRAMGSFGDIGCFSLQFCKIITAGEGGLVVTSNPILYEKMIRLHDQGQVRKAHLPALGGETSLEDCVGENCRLDELRGAVALAQIRKLDRILARLRENYLRIKSAMWPGPYRFRRSPDPAGDVCCDLLIYHDGTREQVDEWLRLVQAEGIPAERRYGGRTVYQYPVFRAMRGADDRPKHPDGLCPHTEELLSRSSCVPVAIDLTAEECQVVTEVLNRATESVYGKQQTQKQPTNQVVKGV